LTVLRKFYLDDEVLTLPQYQEGQLLINDNTETLDEIALLKRAEYIKVADGELLPSKLQRILDAFETPAQRKSRVRLAKIAKLLSTAQANDNKTDGKQALVYLDELLTLDPYHGEAKALRQKIMRYYPQVGDTRTNSLGMKFVYIPAGSFEMGSPSYEAGREDDEQRHSVTLTEGFWLGQHEVTVASFQSFVRATRYLTTADIKGNAYGFTKEGNKLVDGLTWQSPGIDQNDHHPVVQVSWNDAMAYCQWLTKKEGNLYTLPTEAQWEYACRGGTTTMYSFGGSVEQGEGYLNIADEDFETWVGIFGHTAKNRVRWHDGYGTTAPIGSFRANGFGLYDMHGNVWEWCSDWFGKEYYSTGPAQDPTGPTSGQYRVLRGGSWRIRPGLCRSAIRNWRSPGIRNINIGFRILSLDF
jgi:sulfatase modifying factor 1